MRCLHRQLTWYCQCVFLCFILTTWIVPKEVSGLKCFLDISGIKRPDNDDEKVDTSRFKQYDCSLQGGKVEKPCMTKTDKTGIVTRNCATIAKNQEGCEEDVHGNILCYCLTDFCNGAYSNIQSVPTLTLGLALGLVIFLNRDSFHQRLK